MIVNEQQITIKVKMLVCLESGFGGVGVQNSRLLTLG